MSIRAMNWAWEQKMAPTPKLILMALADSANDSDECWPGIPFIAVKCCVSQRTVQRVFQKFETTGLMSITRRYTTAGRQTSNGYRLRVGRNPDNLSLVFASPKIEGANLSGSGVTSGVTDGGDKVMSPLEPLYEPKQQPLLHFPRQLSATEKNAISELIAAINHEDAQALLDELADSLESKTIKTSALRWFRALVVKQKSGTFFPIGGIQIAERRNRQEKELLTKKITPEPPITDRNIARNALAQAKQLIAVKQPQNSNKKEMKA